MFRRTSESMVSLCAATVKRFSRRNGHVWLLPENEDYQPIDGTYASILGRVIAVIRRYD